MLGLEALIRREFPQDDEMLRRFTTRQEKLASIGSIVGQLRNYPLDRQAQFISQYLAECLQGISVVGPEYTEAPARMLANINMIPTRSPDFTMEEIQNLIYQGMIASNITVDGPAQVLLTEDLDEVERKAAEGVTGMYSGYRLRAVHLDAFDALGQIGRDSDVGILFHHLVDTAYSGLFVAAVVDDFIEASGWSGYGRYGNLYNRWHIYANGLQKNEYLREATTRWLRHLEYASAWEVVSGLMEKRGYTNGNPFGPFVTIARPGLLPVFWNNEQFLVARIARSGDQIWDENLGFHTWGRSSEGLT